MKKLLLISIINLQLLSSSFGQLTVNATQPVNTIAGSLIGAGVLISNVTYSGNTQAKGTFQCTSCPFAINQGIILATGSIINAIGPNNIGSNGSSFGDSSVDPELGSIATGNLNDAAILEFDFEAIADTVTFNYVFGSEEYPEYVCSNFNDVFGFFVSGPGITGTQNIALIPGTTLPVAINTVNPGVPGSSGGGGTCQSLAYSSYYFDNTGGAIVQYDGLTTLFSAAIYGIQQGQVYHIKLAIADLFDSAFDSGVFLEAGTFRSMGPMAMYVGSHRTLVNDTVHICNGNSVQLSAPPHFCYLWSNGETTNAITVNQTGNYSVQVIGSNSLYPYQSQTINFVVSNSSIPTPQITASNGNLYCSVNSTNYTYNWTFNGMPITNANADTLATNQLGCYSVTLYDTIGGCFASSALYCNDGTQVSELPDANDISIFPNPTTNQFQVSSLKFKVSGVSIYNVLGELIMSKVESQKSKEQVIDISALMKGVYIIEVTTEQGLVRKKLIKE